MVEAKQLPIEHPKDYDRATGETSWAATACALLPADLLERLGGFDAETFFLYCDDVDLSWRVRLAGRTVVYQPSASVFHDKALGARGAWVAGEAERRFSAEAALLSAYKYDRDDIVAGALQYFGASDEPHLRAAVEEFGRRKASRRAAAENRERTQGRGLRRRCLFQTQVRTLMHDYRQPVRRRQCLRSCHGRWAG